MSARRLGRLLGSVLAIAAALLVGNVAGDFDVPTPDVTTTGFEWGAPGTDGGFEWGAPGTDGGFEWGAPIVGGLLDGSGLNLVQSGSGAVSTAIL
nr:hypothetical protein [Micromonospora sp. DSM 115978]